jgi:hypothetical protein
MTRLAIAVASALCIAVVAAPAHAAKPESVRYRVTVEGKQTTKWKSSYTATQKCDQSSQGSGKETVRFSTTPLEMKATKLGPTLIMWGTLKGHAKVNRQGHIFSDPLPPECEGTDGRPGGTPQTPPKRDCGTKNENFSVGLRYVDDQVNPAGFAVAGSHGRADYRNCPVIGLSFPTLVENTSAGKQVLAKIEPKELLDPSVGKHIILADGKRNVNTVVAGSHTRWTSKIEWKVTLRRLKG